MPDVIKKMVETRGVEPLTSAMPLQRSAKLSYVPINESRVRSFEFRVAETTNFEFIEYREMRQGRPLLPSKNRFSLFEKCRHTFFFVLGREADREQIDLTAEAFVEIRA